MRAFVAGLSVVVVNGTGRCSNYDIEKLRRSLILWNKCHNYRAWSGEFYCR